jgi:hypothetical protein
MLMKKLKEPSPGTLNTGLMTGLKVDPNKLTIPSPINISTQIKKGRSAGHTTLNHNTSPSNAAEKASPGYRTILMTNRQNMIEYIKVERFLLFIAYL